MSTPIEDYALLSNCRTAALVSLHGDLDWLCVPRFDSGSVFGALLGDERHGRWSLRPTDPDARVARRYDGDTFILVTTWATNTGSAQVIDAMPIGDDTVVVRRVVGLEGVVELGCDVRFRFDYARAIPWVHQVGTESAPACAPSPARIRLSCAASNSVATTTDTRPSSPSRRARPAT